MKKDGKTLTNLAKSNNRENRTRSSLITISIVLTTMLLTIIGLVIHNEVETRRVNAGIANGSFYGAFFRVQQSQLDTMKLRSEFTEIGLQSMAGMVKDEDATMVLYYVDDTAMDMMGGRRNLTEGKFPQLENEITGPVEFFQQLGNQNPEIGDRIQLESRIDNDHKYEMQEFVIAGFTKIKDEAKEKAVYAAFISEAYYKNVIPEGQESYTVYFNLVDGYDITASNSKEVMQELAKSCDIDPQLAEANYSYLLWSKNPGMDIIAGGIFICCVVIFFSILVIYNIFQVGLVQKVQEYGKIKALGATKRQMKRVILREGMSLTVFGIPVGLCLGYLITVVFYAWVGQYNNDQTIEGYQKVGVFSLPIFVLVVFLVILTVYLALRKPMKVVAKISPVQAIRFQDSKSATKGIRKGKLQLSVTEMTLANMKGNRKRTIMTIATLGLSCVLFVVLSNIIGNFDIDYETRKHVEYGQFYIDVKYSLSDTAYPENNLDHIQPKVPISEELLKQIQAIPGVTGVRTRKVLCVTDPKDETSLTTIGVYNRQDFKNYARQYDVLGTCDYDTLSAQDGIIYGSIYFMKEYGIQIGDQFNLQIHLDGKTVPFQTQLLGADPAIRYSWGITEDTFKRLGISAPLDTELWVECSKEDCAKVEEALKQFMESNPLLELTTYEEEYNMNRLTLLFMSSLTNAFLAVIGIIGFMNMTNTMITSIITRRRELGILQAIGMTNRQLNRMLQLEGMIFTIGTVLVATVIGSPIGYLFFKIAKGKGIIGLNVYHFPWLELLIMTAVIGVLQSILSYVMSKNLRKDSLVERISYLG